MDKPKVSICVPTYKQTYFLEKNLDSILIQNYTDYEVIITDDTPDETVGDFLIPYIERFEGKLSYFKNENQLGSPENWNEAIRKSEGKYIKILHHDDWFAREDSLRRLVEAIESGPSRFIFSYSLSSEGKRTHVVDPHRIQEINKDPGMLFLANIIGAPSATMFVKNDLIFDVNLKWLVDIDYYIRLIQNGLRLDLLAEDLVCVTNGAEHQITNDCINDINVMLYEYFYVYGKLRNSISKNRRKYIELLFVVLGRFGITKLSQIELSGYKGPPLGLRRSEYLSYKLMKLKENVLARLRNGLKSLIILK